MATQLETYSHYSIQEAFCHIDTLVKKAQTLKLKGLALTDRNSLSGAVEFLQEIEKANKSSEHKIKPIIGCRLLINNLKDYNVILIAKNKQGYFNLCKILGKMLNHTIDYKDIVKNNLGQNLIALCSDREILDVLGCEHSFTMGEYPDFGQPELDIINSPVHYVESEDKLYQKIIICSKLQCTLANVGLHFDKHPEYAKFFNDELDFSLKAPKDDSADKVCDLVEVYSLNDKPNIPILVKDNPDEVLTQLCRDGWTSRRMGKKVKDPTLKQVYVDRIKLELDVFKQAGLANYMLVIRDFIQFAKTKKVSIGLRGSAVGCLVSYLIGISEIDPLQPDPNLPYSADRELLFSRFFNWGRAGSYPDIDVDMPISFRSNMIQYAEDKYGKEQVGYIVTFNRMDGRGAVKEVFRVLEPVDNAFNIANNITRYMVDTAKVQDVLEDLKEDHPDYNIIQYNIDHIPEVASAYQDYKEIFDIAIKLSSTIRNTGKHAAGVIISNKPLEEVSPIMYDDNGRIIVALDMADAEACGLVKYDFLGVAAYEKLDKIIEMINTKATQPIVGNLETDND